MIVKTLSQKYARLRGEYSRAETTEDGAWGLDAIDAATARVVARKMEIRKQLDAIEIVIRLYEPHWDSANIRPIKSRKKFSHPKGEIARSGYSALREANNQPMTVSEIASDVAPKLGYKHPDDKTLSRLRSVIYGAFMRRDDLVEMIEGNPPRWRLRNYVPVPSADAFSSTRTKTATARVPPQRAAAS